MFETHENKKNWRANATSNFFYFFEKRGASQNALFFVRAVVFLEIAFCGGLAKEAFFVLRRLLPNAIGYAFLLLTFGLRFVIIFLFS